MDSAIRQICQLNAQPPYYLVGILGCIKPLAMLKAFGSPKIYNVVVNTVTVLSDFKSMGRVKPIVRSKEVSSYGLKPEGGAVSLKQGMCGHLGIWPQDEHGYATITFHGIDDVQLVSAADLHHLRIDKAREKEDDEVQQLISEATYDPTKLLIIGACAGLSMMSVATDLKRLQSVVLHGGSLSQICLRGVFVLSISSFPATTSALFSISSFYEFCLGLPSSCLYDRVMLKTNEITLKADLAILCGKGKLWLAYYRASMLVMMPYRVILWSLGVLSLCVYFWIAALLGVAFSVIIGDSRPGFLRVLNQRGWLSRFAQWMVHRPAHALSVEDSPLCEGGARRHSDMEIPLAAWHNYFRYPLFYAVAVPFFVPCLLRFIGGDGYLGAIESTWGDRHIRNYTDALLMKAVNATATGQHEAEAVGAGDAAGVLNAFSHWLLTLGLVI